MRLSLFYSSQVFNATSSPYGEQMGRWLRQWKGHLVKIYQEVFVFLDQIILSEEWKSFCMTGECVNTFLIGRSRVPEMFRNLPKHTHKNAWKKRHGSKTGICGFNTTSNTCRLFKTLLRFVSTCIVKRDMYSLFCLLVNKIINSSSDMCCYVYLNTVNVLSWKNLTNEEL